MNKTLRTMIALCLLGVFAVFPAYGERPEGPSKDKGQTLGKSSGQTKIEAILNINNFTMWQKANGIGAYPPNVSGDGGVYPRGTKWVIFADGMVWGAKAYTNAAKTQTALNQLIRVGGSTYNTGNQVGWIQGTGASATAISSADPRARIYRIRRDYTTMSETELRLDAAENNLVLPASVGAADIAATVAQYAKDWDEWPVSLGAPYIERNGIPGFQKPPAFSETFTVDSLIAGSYDEPGLAGIDPGSPASQVIWFVMNDLNRGNMIGFAGSEPMGLEMQMTMWGYKRNDAMGNLFFKRLKIINKGGADFGGGQRGAMYLDSMYVAQWSDPDLGAFGDDLAGVDSVLSLGFVYNGSAVDAEFAKFNLPPPAMGYDFLAGPMVPGAPTDRAVFDLKYRVGYKNLPLTSFCWFAAGAAISDPPFNYEGGLRWYRMLQGYVPDPSVNPLRRYPHPPGQPETFFPLSGDPFRGTGFLDGQGQQYSFAPGDRRIVLNTGPFNLAPGDTQEVTVGVVAGLGGDRLSSVAVMKANDVAVQTTYDLLFQVSQPPAAPLVSAVELDGKIILEWGSNIARVRDTEGRVSQPGSYRFEGYNIYQLASPGQRLSEAKRLATYDVVNGVGVILDTEFDLVAGQFLSKPVQFGGETGIRRYYEVTRDAVRDIDKLYNGQEYYFAVTAYSRATEAGYAAALESSPIVVTARPKKPFGLAPTTAFRDTIAVTRVSGPSDGFVVAQVVNPTAITGDTYQVRFAANMTWSVVNTTKNQTLFTGETNQRADEASPIVDGMQIKVSGAPNDVKSFFTVSNAAGPLNPPEQGAFAFNNSGFPFLTTVAPGSLNDRPNGARQQTTATLTSSRGWGIHTGSVSTDLSYSHFVSRVFRGTNFSRFVPYDWEIRFTAAGGKAAMAFTTGALADVPFELWNIGVGTPNDPSDDYRVIPWVFDSDGNDLWNIVPIDHQISTGTDDPETDWIYFRDPINRSSGSAGYNQFVAEMQADTYAYDSPEVMARLVLVLWNGGQVGDPTFPANLPQRRPENGTTFRIIATKPNTPSDVFAINTANYVPRKGLDLEQTAVDRITVFPNPYYAFNPAETNRFVRFVTINNLPRKATVRIFNLVGQLVRTLEKDDDSQFLRWDLNNTYNFPVASGVYIAHLEVTLSDGSTATKTLKIAIIQEQEVPDVF